MAIDREKLMQTATERLRRLDVIAAPIAVLAALLMIFVIDVQWSLAILLSLGVYAGVYLLRPDSKPVEPVSEPITPELQKVAESRSASMRIAEAIPSLPTDSARELLARIVAEIDKMLDAIEEDASTDEARLAAAPLYYTRMVGQLDGYLAKAIRLKRRGVRLAETQFERLVSEDLPHYEKAAEEFYQEYHNQEVLDLAALAEILRYNLDSIDQNWTDEENYEADEFDPTSPGTSVSKLNGKVDRERTKTGGDK